jgi:hypothetical protein
MTWTWLSDVRGAGLLTSPAIAFARRELGDGDVRGAPLLLALARAIDAFASREVSAQEEARFVEGAGALFGIVLLSHVGEGEHVSRDGANRLRLGRAGFVDPFAAIERALAEGPAKALLVEATRLAEQEARGEGPIARVALAFERALAAQEDGRTITARFDRALFVGEIEVDLTRTIEATAFESEGTLTRSVLKLVEMLPGGRGRAVDRAEAEARLFPRLLGPTFALADAVVTVPLALDLRAGLVLAYDGRSRFVAPSDLERWALSITDALAIAVSNLGTRAREPRLARVETDHGTIVMARTGDGLDSARLLSPSLRALLALELGDPFLIAVPHRDVVLACRAGVDALAATMAARTADDAARAPHAISERLYVSERGTLVAR